MKRSVRIGVVLLMTLGWLAPAAQAGAGGGCHGAALTDERTDEVKTTMACFVPTVARIDVGDTVTFFNGDGMEHNVTGVPQLFTATSRNGDRLLPDTRAGFRFDEPGVYPYVCTIHPMMAGAIVVGDGVPEGAAAVSGSAGGNDNNQAAGAAPPAADEAITPASATVPWAPAAAILVAMALAGLIAWALRSGRRGEPEPHLG